MRRSAALSGLILALGLLPAWPEESPSTSPPAPQLLQAAVQEVLRRAGPAVVSVCVSRSDAYQRYGLAEPGRWPGELGGLEQALLEQRLALLPQPLRRRLAHQLDLADPQTVPEAYGGGVLLDAEGLVLTLYHLVQGARKVFVCLPKGGGSYADIWAADPRSDLAVLRLLARRSYPQVRCGAGDALQRGQLVVALFLSPSARGTGAEPAASLGMVSRQRTERAPGVRDSSARRLPEYGALVQADVRLSTCASGVALFNLQGDLVGMTTALAEVRASSTPGPWALLLDAAQRRIVDLLCQGREVEYGFLGVRCDSREASGEGVPVQAVTPGSPADRAGIHARDVLLALNGQPIHCGADLYQALAPLLAGTEVTLTVRPVGSPRAVSRTLRLAKLYVPGVKIAANPAPRPFFRGLRVDDTSLLVQEETWAQVWQRIPLGVVVSEVRPNSPAATALLRPGDVITQVNDHPVASPADFYEQVRNCSGPVTLTLSSSQPGQPPPRVLLP
jgi:serine protease Do